MNTSTSNSLDLTQVTDLHNRRDNLVTVSQRAKSMGIPLLIWPEDRLILRQTDLPVLYRHVNKPVDWIVMSELRTFRVRGDDDLRNEIQANFAYAVTDSDNVIDYVTEFEVRSR